MFATTGMRDERFVGTVREQEWIAEAISDRSLTPILGLGLPKTEPSPILGLGLIGCALPHVIHSKNQGK